MTDDLRAQLLARLANWSDLAPYGCLPPVQREAVADALLPIVEAHRPASAAAALARAEALADRWERIAPGMTAQNDRTVLEHIAEDLRGALRGDR